MSCTDTENHESWAQVLYPLEDDPLKRNPPSPKNPHKIAGKI